MKDLIAAIDLGTTKTIVVVGEKTNLGVKVVAYGEAPSRGIKRGRIENVKYAHQSLEKALRKAGRTDLIGFGPDCLIRPERAARPERDRDAAPRRKSAPGRRR